MYVFPHGVCAPCFHSRVFHTCCRALQLSCTALQTYSMMMHVQVPFTRMRILYAALSASICYQINNWIFVSEFTMSLLKHDLDTPTANSNYVAWGTDYCNYPVSTARHPCRSRLAQATITEMTLRMCSCSAIYPLSSPPHQHTYSRRQTLA